MLNNGLLEITEGSTVWRHIYNANLANVYTDILAEQDFAYASSSTHYHPQYKTTAVALVEVATVFTGDLDIDLFWNKSGYTSFRLVDRISKATKYIHLVDNKLTVI